MPKEKLTVYGGQAVMEGVMMRGQRAMAVAVRAPDGSIKLHTEPLDSVYNQPLFKLPFIRGLLGLWDALGLGMRSLLWSANVAVGEEAVFSGPLGIGTVLFSLTLAISLFFLTPALIGSGFDAWLGLDPLTTNLIEGLARLVIVIAYISLIALMSDVKRLYGYHGAEHKTINAFEAGAELTPANVAKFSLYHPRCGTAFILIVVLFSIVLFTLLGDLPFWLKLVSRVLAIPVLAALAYEYLRFTARNITNPVIRALALPGLWMQRLTTREPDLTMLEVAIVAFQEMQRTESATAELNLPDRVLPAAEAQPEATP